MGSDTLRTLNLALENFAFAILAVARPFAFPDRDLAQLAFVFAEDLQKSLSLSMMYITSATIFQKCIANDNIVV